MFRYRKGEPKDTGVYACRVIDDSPDRVSCYEPLRGMVCDSFLYWFDNAWHHPMSLTVYTGQVVGWIGPLQR